MRIFGLDNIIYFPYIETVSKLHGFLLNYTLVAADVVGLRSKEVCFNLIEKGFNNIILLAGGLVDLEQSGLAVIKNLKKNHMASVFA